MMNWMEAIELDQLPNFDQHLAADDPSAVLADAFALAAALDRKMTTDREAGPRDLRTPDVGEKLRKWLERLIEMLHAVARRSETASYSITVGTGVSVSVTFSGG